MSILIYNLSLFFYRLGIHLASPFNPKAKQWLDGRKDWKKKIEATTLNAGKRVWIHCASLGEFEQARPLIEKIKLSPHPSSTQIILTFFSPSGYEIRRNYEHADLVLYLPFDSKSNAASFLELIKPDLVLFVKYEFWFHYLTELKHRNIPTLLFSGVFRKEQVFFHWYGSLFRSMLCMFTKIFVQNNVSKELLKGIDIESELAFDTRFDRVIQVAQNRKQFSLIEQFKGNSKILIAGSTWKIDEELIVQCINENLLPGYKFIIAPHDIDLNRIEAFQQKIKIHSTLFSALNNNNAAQMQVVIIDHIGSLNSLYAYGDIAYVGGGFNTSVHNVLEAVVFDLPVVFGPNYHKSEEAKELLQQGEAFTVSSFNELKDTLTQNANKSSMFGRDYIFERKGGTEKIFDYIKQFLK